MIPERARAVVIGGGVFGCSCLYHLAKLGWTDSVLVEQFQLTHGSTWHSAGLVGQLRSSLSLTRMMQYSVGLYAELKELTGNDPGWHQLGGLRLASSQPRLEEIRRQAAWAKTFGLPMEIVSAEEAQERFPPMSIEGVLNITFGSIRLLADPPEAPTAYILELNDIAVNVYPQIPLAGSNTKDRNVIWRRSEKSTEAHAHLVNLISGGKADAAERFWRSYMLDTAAFMQKSGLANLRVTAPKGGFGPRPSTRGVRNLGAARLRGT